MKIILFLKIVCFSIPFVFECNPVEGEGAASFTVEGVGAASFNQSEFHCISGIYPHLAVFNNDNECGIGAVVPWAGRLWFLTYPPHGPKGSDDKLYSIDTGLHRLTFSGSVGGTHACRMIHRESNQLLIGPYLIDNKGNIRTISPSRMPGRLTAVTRHLEDPARKVYYFDMEGKIYEVDVKSLEVKELFDSPVPGCHGKGAYTGQGRLIIANNGEKAGVKKEKKEKDERGVLAEWDGKNWKVIERKQFTDVTGPGGIYGSRKSKDPVWSIGWDKRSVILKLLDSGVWSTYRLPKASHTYDAAHGWYTEWPRIRSIGNEQLLMNMHGMFYLFPRSFCRLDSSGVKPLSMHLKMVVDFCKWNGRIVFACDDASMFENPLLGQSQSNLWFVDGVKGLKDLGPPAGWGGPWLGDDLPAGAVSDPFLFPGSGRRVVHVSHESGYPVTFIIEIDRNGDNNWEKYTSLTVPAKGYCFLVFPGALHACWIRFRTSSDSLSTRVYFHYSSAVYNGGEESGSMFKSLPPASCGHDLCGGIIRPRGAGLGTLQYISRWIDDKGKLREQQYEVYPDMSFKKRDDPKSADWFKKRGDVKGLDYKIDRASVIIESNGVRYRLPKGDASYDSPFATGWPRGKREVVTERSLWNCHGTFYEIPRPSSGGVEFMQPVCTHNRAITDYCSWRGLLVIAGTFKGSTGDGHFFGSKNGGAGPGLWFGVVDDLWKLGKPSGRGGPWAETPVKAGTPSDPFLMTGYDRKLAGLSHDLKIPVAFTFEVNFDHYSWHFYKRIEVPAGKTIEYNFPQGFSAHWIRVTAERDCRATCTFIYK